MKTLLRKELQENMKLAALGLVIYTVLLCQQYNACMHSMVRWTHPLTYPAFLVNTAWFCGLFGAALGWLQIHNERRPDLWAFLLHRPVTRTCIFFSKVIAGLCLYAVAAGLPLSGYLVWAGLPGHVAAPFESAMLRPGLTIFLAGTVAYFAGMLTGLRQARWYASRALGVGVAVLAFGTIWLTPAYWQSLAILCVAAGVLVLGAWAAFGSDGRYEGQPAWGKAALTCALMVGSAVVLVAATRFLGKALPENKPVGSWSEYVMSKTGAVLKVTHSAVPPTDNLRMEVEPLDDPKARRVTNWDELLSLYKNKYECYIALNTANHATSWLSSDCSLFRDWEQTADTAWYYWRRYGRLVGYDSRTRRVIGSLGPEGFARDVAGSGDRFTVVGGSWHPRTLGTATTIFLPDVEQRTVKPLFTTAQEGPVMAAHEIWRPDFTWDYTAVCTKGAIFLLTKEGTPVWKAPYEPAYPRYGNIKVFALEPRGQFALWIEPSFRVWEQSKEALPIRSLWLAADKGVVRSMDLPGLPYRHSTPQPADLLTGSLIPLPLLVIVDFFMKSAGLGRVPQWLLLLNGAVAAFVWLPIGWWLGRRYRFSLAAQTGWAVFHLLFGVSGLLAFLSVQEWPAREACPNCKKLRAVDHAQCEHCGAGFAPPEKTGTEVFAPLGAKAEPQAAG
jgi:hypothetical protein